MISSIQFREPGLGLGDLFTEELRYRVNVRRAGERYTSSQDAFIINNAHLKPHIIDDPLLRHFLSGVNEDSYWTSLHKKIQLEDAYDHGLWPDNPATNYFPFSYERALSPAAYSLTVTRCGYLS